ncbi:MAG TPA: GAF and ANTAR domain-containing protein [Pseudolysinimonas sp.]|nr:GAF and ANTAR domain-containing protein [Pseudolysinimonas sp.]
MATDPDLVPADGARTEPDLCHPFLQNLPITGASVTVVNASRSQHSVCSSDSIASRVDELQFEFGEGPQWKAVATGELVVVPDMAADLHGDWPIFWSEVRQLAVGALFAVPMRMGAVTVGAVTLYRSSPGDLSPEQRSSALAIGSAIASAAVHRAMRSALDDDEDESPTSPAFRREVHQATGMILAQLNTTATIAYSRLQAYAFAHGRHIQDVARDVVNRDLTFEE